MPEKLTWIKLNPYVSVSCQPNSLDGHIPVKDDDVSPSIILLFGWMGARFLRVLEYADSLHELFPTSTIVIIGSWAEFVWRSQSHLNAAMLPVVELLQNEQNQSSRFRGALVHVISNGGGWQYMTLRKMLLNSQSPNSVPEPVPTALILDSVPDDKGLRSSLRAVSPTNPVLRILVFPYLICLYIAIYLYNRIMGRAPLFVELRAALLQPENFALCGFWPCPAPVRVLAERPARSRLARRAAYLCCRSARARRCNGRVRRYGPRRPHAIGSGTVLERGA